jgi:hypothetical protein
MAIPIMPKKHLTGINKEGANASSDLVSSVKSHSRRLNMVHPVDASFLGQQS